MWRHPSLPRMSRTRNGGNLLSKSASAARKSLTLPPQISTPARNVSPLHHQERRQEYYVNVELPNIDRVNELHAIARAKRCPPKRKDCAVPLLYDKASRNDILTGVKLFSGKFGSVIVMVAALYDKIGGDDVLADAHAKCRKTFVANRSVVTCSDECSDAWRVIYRLGYDETNRDEINEERRDKLAANSDGSIGFGVKRQPADHRHHNRRMRP